MYNYFRKILSKIFGLYFHDLFKKTKIKKSYKKLLLSQHWNDKDIKELQTKKLNFLVEFCINNNEFYKKKYSHLLNSKFNIKNLDDLKRLPILTKTDLRLNSLLSNNLNMKRVSNAKTGGTTGPPTVIYKNVNTRSIAWGAWYRWYNWMGIKQGDPCMTLWGAPLVLSKSSSVNIYARLTSFIENDYRVNSFNINNLTIDKIIDNLFYYKPIIIRGYLSAILQLADYMNEYNIKYEPKCISTTSETLLPPFRKYIEKTFNCLVYDQYASTEISGVAFECSSQKGLHITSEHVIVEILDDNNQPIYDKKGRIIITDLDNRAMPFIRYEIGDIGILSTEKCTCGINLPLLKSIEGRLADNIILKDGSKVHGVFFTDIMHELKTDFDDTKISRFQAVQNKIGYLEFRLESSISNNHRYCKDLKKALIPFFNDIDIKTFQKLENEKSGKFKFVISDL